MQHLLWFFARLRGCRICARNRSHAMGHTIRRLNPCIVSHRSAVWSHNTTHTKTRAAVAASMPCECDADDGRLERFKTTTEITFEISQGHYYWCYSRGPYDFRIPLTFDVWLLWLMRINTACISTQTVELPPFSDHHICPSVFHNPELRMSSDDRAIRYCRMSAGIQTATNM